MRYSKEELKEKYINQELDFENNLDELKNYGIRAEDMLVWEEEGRKRAFLDIKNRISIFDGTKKEANMIWKKIGLHTEYNQYWNILEFVEILEAMNKKNIFSIPFSIGIKKYNGTDNINITYIEEYFLNDNSPTKDILYRKIMYGIKGFSGLLPYCLYNYSYQYNFSTLYVDLVKRIIQLLIIGIKNGGIICVRLAMLLYRFIYKLDNLGEANFKEKMLEDLMNNYSLSKDAFLECKRINSVEDYFIYCSKKNEDKIIYDVIKELETENNKIFRICGDKKKSTLEKNSEINMILYYCDSIRLNGLINFIKEVEYTHFNLSKLYYFFQRSYCDFLKYDDNRLSLLEELTHLLIEKSKKDYLHDKKKVFNGLIPYCYHNYNDWIFEMLVWAAYNIENGKDCKINIRSVLDEFLEEVKMPCSEIIANEYRMYNT